MQMMQGDAYRIPFEVADATGEPVVPEQVASIEFAVGSLVKSYPAEVEYADGAYLFPLTQQETFAMGANAPAQVRVKFASGDVVGAYLGHIDVRESLSKAVL